MKILIRVMAITMLMVFAGPAYSEAIQIYNCTFEGEATEDDVHDMAEKWLAAAKTLPGGKNLQVAIRYPLAASVNDIDFKFVVITPNFADWGALSDAYEASKLQEIDHELFKIANCGESSRWEGGMVE